MLRKSHDDGQSDAASGVKRRKWIDASAARAGAKLDGADLELFRFRSATGRGQVGAPASVRLAP